MESNTKSNYPTPDFLRDTAYEYAKLGISIIPVDELKSPTVSKWKPFQEHIPTIFEINNMFFRNTYGIAGITGRVSGNAELLDIDCKYDLTGTMFDDYMKLLAEVIPSVISKLIIAKTMNKGYHLLYRCATISGNLKIASRPATDVEQNLKPQDKVKVLFETRGEGGYFLLAPTPGYEFIQGDLNDIQEITIEERETLLSIAKSFDLMPKYYEAPKAKQAQKDYGVSPFEDYNKRGDVIALLEKHGWTVVYSQGSKTFLKRPGDSKTKQSGNFNADKNWFSVFSSSTVFEIQKAYLPYAVYAMLECGGDFSEAAKRLLSEGFGTYRQTQNNNSNNNTGGNPNSNTNANSGNSFSNNQNHYQYQDVSHLPTHSFPQEVYDNLPEFLKTACNVFTTQTERDVFLVGSLGVLSGCFPNYYSYYDSHRTACNLFIFIYGPASAGKGTLVWARKLGAAIHDYHKANYNEDKQQFDKDVASFKAAKKDKSLSPDAEAPKEPKRIIFFIPADTSTSAIIEALSNNNGRGIIFATEADSLSVTLGQEWGNFSGILRAGFHGEPFAMLRRKDNEFAEVERPEFGVVLTGTPGQVFVLIPTPENGLNSRFGYFSIDLIPEMKDVFASTVSYDDHFGKLGILVFELYKKLDCLANGICFEFTANQKKTFVEEYTISHGDFYKSLGDSSIASIRRLALINYRIAMILSMLRAFEHFDFTDKEALPLIELPSKITCNDTDFENAYRITQVLKENARKLLLSYPKEFVNPFGLKGDILKFYKALPFDVEFTYEEAMVIADSCAINRETAQGYLYNKLVPKKLLQHSHNKYFKAS